MFTTRHVGCVTLIFSQRGVPHRRTQAFKDRVLVCSNNEPCSVLGGIHVARGNFRQDRTCPLTLHAPQGPVWDERLHNAKHRLIDRRIDDLASATAFTFVECSECAHSGEHPCERIPYGNADTRGRLFGVSYDITQSPHRLTNRTVPSTRRVRSALTKARHSHHDELRLF